MKNKGNFAKTILLIFIIISFAVIIILIIVFFIFGGNSDKININEINKAENQVLLFAHRGISNYKAENSLAAINKARNKNFKGLEIDINVTKDNHIILFHDNNALLKLGINSNINEINYEDLDSSYIINGIKTNSEVIDLRSLFDIFSNQFVYYLDFKVSELSVAEKIITCIKERGLEKHTIIASADFIFLAEVEYYYPEINTCLEGFNSGKEWIYNLIPTDFKPDYLSSFIHNVDKNHIDWLIDNKLINNKIVYGVDSSNYLKAEEFKLKNIIIDYDSSYLHYFRKHGID